MSPITVGRIVLACVVESALVGTLLHAILPQAHLSLEFKDIIKLGVGLVGIMAALCSRPAGGRS